MVSDILWQAVQEIDQHLTDPVLTYTGKLRERIIRCRNEMERMRAELDTPPGREDNPCIPDLISEESTEPLVFSGNGIEQLREALKQREERF